MKSFILAFVLISFISGLTGCVTSQTRDVFYQVNRRNQLKTQTLSRLLWENEIKEGQNIENTTILRTDLASYHLIQLRGSEVNHRHDFHDLVVFVKSGFGMMHLEEQSFPVRSGAVIFIPHGIFHYFENRGAKPAVAIAVFSPPFDKEDVVYMPKKEKSKEEKEKKKKE